MARGIDPRMELTWDGIGLTGGFVPGHPLRQPKAESRVYMGVDLGVELAELDNTAIVVCRKDGDTVTVLDAVSSDSSALPELFAETLRRRTPDYVGFSDWTKPLGPPGWVGAVLGLTAFLRSFSRKPVTRPKGSAYELRAMLERGVVSIKGQY